MIHFNWYKPFEKGNNKTVIFPKDLMKKKTMGKYTYLLENKLKKILKVKNVVLTTSGTSALMMASMALNIKPNKKIICSNLTWIATINPSLILGAKIYLVDTDKNTQKVNFNKLNKTIKKIKPDIVILVHLTGEVAENKEFTSLKKKYRFKVIEDASQGMFNKYDNGKYCGTKFEIGCFSLSVTKIINMVYGGFCTTNSNYLADKLRTIRNNGVNAEPEYAKLELPVMKGLNLKPSDLHAFIGIQNLKNRKLIVKKVKEIFSRYKKRIKNSKITLIETKNISIYPSVIVEKISKFSKFCQKNNIQLHYGVRCLSESSELKQSSKKFPNSIFCSKNLVRLPGGPGYKLKEIDRIIKIINKY